MIYLQWVISITGAVSAIIGIWKIVEFVSPTEEAEAVESEEV